MQEEQGSFLLSGSTCCPGHWKQSVIRNPPSSCQQSAWKWVTWECWSPPPPSWRRVPTPPSWLGSLTRSCAAPPSSLTPRSTAAGEPTWSWWRSFCWFCRWCWGCSLTVTSSLLPPAWKPPSAPDLFSQTQAPQLLPSREMHFLQQQKSSSNFKTCWEAVQWRRVLWRLSQDLFGFCLSFLPTTSSLASSQPSHPTIIHDRGGDCHQSLFLW